MINKSIASKFASTLFTAIVASCSLSSTATLAATAVTTDGPVRTNLPAVILPSHLLIDSLDGPITTNEMAEFRDLALSQPLPTHNHHNNLVYGGSHQADDLLVAMYEITGDRVFLNRLIEFSDAILACRNDTNTGDLFWTGKRE